MRALTIRENCLIDKVRDQLRAAKSNDEVRAIASTVGLDENVAIREFGVNASWRRQERARDTGRFRSKDACPECGDTQPPKPVPNDPYYKDAVVCCLCGVVRPGAGWHNPKEG